MNEKTTLAISKETKKRLETYKDYPEQTIENLLVSCMNYMDKMATKEKNKKI